MKYNVHNVESGDKIGSFDAETREAADKKLSAFANKKGLAIETIHLWPADKKYVHVDDLDESKKINLARVKKLSEAKKIMATKIAEAKVTRFKKLSVPSVVFEHTDVTGVVQSYNLANGADFSYDAKLDKVVNLTTLSESEEYAAYDKFTNYLKSNKIQYKLVEYDQSNRMSHLFESELEKAQIVLAAQDIVSRLQKIAEDLLKIQTDSVMPLTDEIKLQFGQDIATKFDEVAKTNLDSAFDTVRSAKDEISNEVAKLNGVVNGEPYPTDLATEEPSVGDELDPELADLGDETDMGGEEGDDLFKGAESDVEDLGRVKRESRTKTGKVIAESKTKKKIK